MGSLKISSDPSGVIMSPFKATLWLSVLTVSTVVNHVGAAPVELVAGRVVSHEPLTQNLGFVGDINSLRSLFANGIPAGISLVRTVPQVSHVNHVSHAVPTVNAVSTVPVAKTILHTPASSFVSHSLGNSLGNSSCHSCQSCSPSTNCCPISFASQSFSVANFCSCYCPNHCPETYP